MKATVEASAHMDVKTACEALGVPRSSFYRLRQGRRVSHPRRRPRPPRTLSKPQQQEVLDVLHSEVYVDKAPAQVWAALLDHEGVHLCSVRTMYRVLEANGEVRERRDQARHPRYVKPQLQATAPKQLWSWDVTKLRGPEKRVSYSLYVVIDVFSRYVVGWLISERESAELAQQLFEETYAKEEIGPAQVTVHSDRGSPMTAKSTAQLMADLGLTQSFSRPRVSNDNPYSESQFKTLKYRPEFPGRFGSLADARAFCRRFFDWYNREHYHSSLGLLTPWSVHHGDAERVLSKRQEVLDRAYAAHPERFVGGRPTPRRPPAQVWINEPQAAELAPPGVEGGARDVVAGLLPRSSPSASALPPRRSAPVGRRRGQRAGEAPSSEQEEEVACLQ